MTNQPNREKHTPKLISAIGRVAPPFRFSAILLILLASTAWSSANSEDFTLDFTGVVSNIVDLNGYIPDRFQLGEDITGSVTYTTDVTSEPPGTNPPTVAIYPAVEAMTVQIGGSTWSFQSAISFPGNLQVWNGYPVGNTPEDAAIFQSGFVDSIPVSNTGMLNPLGLAQLFLVNPDLSLLNSTAIPTTQQMLNLLSGSSFINVQQDDSRETLGHPMNFSIQGTFTSVTAVPEPATTWLLLAGVGLVAFTARRCRRLVSSETYKFVDGLVGGF